MKLPHFYTSALFKNYLKKKKTKTLNTVNISKLITIYPQNKPDKIYSLQLLNKTRYKNLFLSLCLSFKCKHKLSPTNIARAIRKNPKMENLDVELSLFTCDGKRIPLSHKRIL